jgi:hypothetical protein
MITISKRETFLFSWEKKIVAIAAMWMSLEEIFLNDVSQLQNKYCRISLLMEPQCGSHRRYERYSRYQKLVRMLQEENIRKKFWC